MPPDQHTPQPPIAAAILAGGESRRFNYQNKALVQINGRAMIEHAISRLNQQAITTVGICANDKGELSHLGYPIIEEAAIAKGGPLRGLLSAMQWCLREHPGKLLLTTPCDTPRLPSNLVAELSSAWLLADCDCVIAANMGRRHPTIGLWQPSLARQLSEHLERSHDLSLSHWLKQCRRLVLDFAVPVDDPFININSAVDLEKLQPHLAP